jgi:hypothetical protein
MITDILKNIFILQLGALLRFLFYYFVKRNKQVTYHSILNGKDKGKTKADEILISETSLLTGFMHLIFIDHCCFYYYLSINLNNKTYVSFCYHSYVCL